MIYGHLKAGTTYSHLTTDPVWAEVFEWIAARAATAELGRHDMRGDDLFAIVMDYETGDANGSRWETHRRYIDLQYTISGGELIHWSPAHFLKPDGTYSDEKEAQFYEPGEPVVALDMSPGYFTVFHPDDAHRAKVSNGSDTSVRKVVFKVACINLTGF